MLTLVGRHREAVVHQEHTLWVVAAVAGQHAQVGGLAPIQGWVVGGRACAQMQWAVACEARPQALRLVQAQRPGAPHWRTGQRPLSKLSPHLDVAVHQATAVHPAKRLEYALPNARHKLLASSAPGVHSGAGALPCRCCCCSRSRQAEALLKAAAQQLQRNPAAKLGSAAAGLLKRACVGWRVGGKCHSMRCSQDDCQHRHAGSANRLRPWRS